MGKTNLPRIEIPYSNEEEKESCSSESAKGQTLNHCEPRPVSFCPKCKCFYYEDEEGDMETISLKLAEEEY